MKTNVALLQGIYFFVSGLWPIVHMASFLKITGPKTDLWLVKTVGVLLSIIGGTLIFANVKPQTMLEIVFLGIGSAAGLAAIEIVYVSKKMISRIYLLDTLIEFIFISWWILAWARLPS